MEYVISIQKWSIKSISLGDLKGESSEKEKNTNNQGHRGCKMSRLRGYGAELPHPHLREGGMIGMLFGGKPQYPPETWEPYTIKAPEPEEDFDPSLAQEWAQVIRVAKNNGVTVNFTEKGISMVHGRSKGLFKDARGGLEMAKEFLSDFM